MFPVCMHRDAANAATRAQGAASRERKPKEVLSLFEEVINLLYINRTSTIRVSSYNLYKLLRVS